MICADFILEIQVGDGRTEVVTTQIFSRVRMLELDVHASSEPDERFGVRAPVGVEDEPVVVIVSVSIKSDLLLFGSSWISVGVGVEDPALAVEVADCDFGPDGDVCVKELTSS